MDGTPATSSTGKVKVEYTDPSGVFPLIASEILSRLPLHNLNWNSPSRPTRSIESLYVDLFPDEKSAAQNAKRSVSAAGLPEPPSSPRLNESRRQSESQAPKRERRHQIPGLRRTPYLKVYLLRCEDADIYKNTSRKLLREWIKANTPASQSNASVSNQENHDAFEWMVLHVVLPDVQNSSIWPSKVSASILDKIRSDFNSSSRNAPDRVAQVPATKDLQVQGVTVSGIPGGGAREPFIQESNRAWVDLISKFKVLILSSFDLRVRQYEEDIKEKGSQRSLPGWNFCTFFVLKEGLARGFESVGLVDDALMGYDELSAELLSALREESSKDTKLFREHTQELLIQAEAALEGKTSPPNRSNYKSWNTSVLDIDKKPYRDLILANNISAFDFRTYVFARQIQMLLRLATVSGQVMKVAGGSSSLANNPSPRDSSVLAEACRRAISFLAGLARTIRQDLRASFKPESGANGATLAARHNVLENIVASWTYQAAGQMLARTKDSALPDCTDEGEGLIQDTDFQLALTGSPDSPRSPTFNPGTGPGINLTDHPMPSGNNQKPSQHLSRNKAFIFQSTEAGIFGKNQLPAVILSLAGERAELYVIARRALSAVGDRRGWLTSWPHRSGNTFEEGKLDDISLEHDPVEDPSGVNVKEESPHASEVAGVLDESMRIALSSEEAFYNAYENLSLSAFKLYQLSGEKKSAYFIIADIAAVRCRLGDYATAASYFHELVPFYAQNRWIDLEIMMLDMYALCLKKLNRVDEYIRTALKTLSKLIQSHRSDKKINKYDFVRLNKQLSIAPSSLNALALASTPLSQAITVPLEDFFRCIRVGPYIQHSADKDGFQLPLSLEYCLADLLMAQEIKVRLLNTREGQTHEIWVSAVGSLNIKPGYFEVLLSSMTVMPDWYEVERIVVHAKNIILQHEYLIKEQVSDPSSQTLGHSPPRSEPAPRVLVWAQKSNCTAVAAMCSEIHLEQPRAISIRLKSGRNKISNAKLVLKARTAGLRLHTTQAEVADNVCEIIKAETASTIKIGPIEPYFLIEIKVPYKLDADTKEINLRFDLTYNTTGGSFIFGDSEHLPVLLPLGVNVQDVFKKDALFSKFAISTSSSIPLRVLGCHLEETSDFQVRTPSLDIESLCVFPKQPVSLVYRITSKKVRRNMHDTRKKLSMRIDYQCLDEEILSAAKRRLERAGEDSGFREYIGLMTWHLESMLRTTIQQQDLDSVGLLREFSLGEFSKVEWHSVLAAVPLERRSLLESWLREWYQSNATIQLSDDKTVREGAVKRRITIPVEIPPLAVLHTASLLVEVRAPTNPFSIGDMISATLRITHTRAWAETRSDSSREALSFYYEVEASPDTWLIAGQRRAYFSALEGETKQFPLMLLPRKAGKLMLPMVEIRPAREEQGVEDGLAACEMDYESQGMMVEVVPGMTSVTLGMRMGAQGGLNGEVEILEVERGHEGVIGRVG